MFTSLLDSTASTLTVSSALICLFAALLFGLVIAVVYMLSTKQYTKNFIVTLALLPVLVEVVILMTSGSLGTAVAVLGTFSLIRFRSAPGTSIEIAGIFFAMAVGLACGMGQIAFAALVTAIVSCLFVVLNRSRFGERKAERKTLKITIPEDLDYAGIFDDIFEKYTSSHRLEKVKTVNLGSLFELDYTIVLKNENQEKDMLDEIRVRNGNLTIVCARQGQEQTLSL